MQLDSQIASACFETDSNTCEFFDTNEAPQNNDDDDNPDYLSDEDGTDDPDTISKLNYLLRHLQSDLYGEAQDLDESVYGHMVLAMMVAEQVGVRMMKEYFEIEVSKATSQYGFRKGLKLFGDKGYQAAKNALEVNPLGRGCIDMMPWKGLTWDIRKQALGYLMFLQEKTKWKDERERLCQWTSSTRVYY